MKFWGILLGLLFILIIAFGISIYFLNIINTTEGPVDLRNQTEVSIVMTEKGFTPDAIRIIKGTKVTFTTTQGDNFWPASNPHPDHSIYPAFDPKGPIDPSSSWAFVFGRVGVWGFHDHLHSYFTGTIYVDN